MDDKARHGFRNQRIRLSAGLIVGLVCLLPSAAVGQHSPSDIVGMGIARNDDVYTWYRNRALVIGASTQLDWHAPQRPYSTAAAVSAKPGLSASDIAGMSIACSNDYVYTWYRNGTVSIGTSSDLASRHAPYPYSLPSGKTPVDIIDVGIARNDYVYAWYRDGTVSIGTSADLDSRRTPYHYALPSGKTGDGLAGIDIACSNDYVYAWYRDGTVSVGTSANLSSRRAPYAYTVPAGKVPADLVSVGIAHDDHVYAWYKDNTVSSGTSGDLDWHRIPYPYSIIPAVAGIDEKRPDNIVGLSIACSNDYVYAWHDDGTVSVGTSGDLDARRPLKRYALPAGRAPTDVVEVGIAGNDYVYAWYRDGTVSIGTSLDLGSRRAPYAYQLPQGKTPADIVGIDIACSNDYVYTWYADGTRSIGTSDDLGRRGAPIAYRLDLAAPEAPTGLHVTATTSWSITLGWKDNSQWEEGFHIYRDGVAVRNPDRNSSYATVGELSANTRYCFRISAWNRAGETFDPEQPTCATTSTGGTQTSSTVKEVSLSYCPDGYPADPSKNGTAHIWMADLTDGTLQDRGQAIQQWPTYGLCPASGSSPFVLALPDGHRVQVIAVVPDRCGANDPAQLSCRRWESSVFVGGKEGKVLSFTIN